MTRGRVVLFSCITVSGIAPLLAQTVTDPALRVETLVQGLSAPTAIAFIGTGGEFFVAQRDGRVLHFGSVSAPGALACSRSRTTAKGCSDAGTTR